MKRRIEMIFRLKKTFFGCLYALIALLVACLFSIVTGIPVWLFLIAILGFVFLIYFFLAPNDIAFTFVREGTAKAVMRSGTFHKMLMGWKGKALDGKGNVIDVKSNTGSWFGGLRLLGIPLVDKIYRYKFEWTGLKPNGEPLHHPPEVMDSIMIKEDVYYAKIEKAEDRSLLPLNVSVVMPVSIINPYKALFAVQNWLEALISLISPAVRDQITSADYEDLIKNKEDISVKLYGSLRGKLKEFEKLYGARIREIAIYEIDPPEEHRAATLRAFNAEQNKKATIIEANAKAEAVLIGAKAEKERIETVYSAVKKADPELDQRKIEGAERISQGAGSSTFFPTEIVDAIKGLGEKLLRRN